MSTMQPEDPAFLSAAQFLSREYHELNGTTIEVLEHPPTALEFSRLVHISRPVIIKGFHVPATAMWANEYLVEKMEDRKISVAATPNGRADAITEGPDGRLFFVEPATKEMTMHELLERVEDGSIDEDVYYLQSQNGNLFSSSEENTLDDISIESQSELAPLAQDVPKDVPWCSEALGQRPDAVNIWIGNDASVTSIHSDPYENIYTVVRGQKHFLLLPPTDSWSLKEKYYPHARYTYSPSGHLTLTPSDKSTPPVRWSSVTDPDAPGAFPEDVHPIHVTLHEGEALYLPVGWWHHVRQSGLTIALNWWYDAEMRGTSWVLLNFLRNTERIQDANEEQVLETVLSV